MSSAGRILFVSVMHNLARMGLGGGVRWLPRKLSWFYASPAKGLDDFFILEEGEDKRVDWRFLLEELRNLELPVGVRRDVLPQIGPWSRDTIGVHGQVLVLGIHPTAFSRNGKLCRLMRYAPLKPLEKGHLRTWDLVTVERWLRGRNVKSIQLEQAIILDEQMGHFGHWLFEQLPQLRLMQEKRDVFVIYNGTDRWKRKLLIDFGWPEDRLIPHMGEEVYEVKQLWTTNGGHLNSKDLAWLRSKGKGCYGEDSGSPRRIYVSRQGVGSRMVTNFNEILPVLEEFDIQVVQPENLGLEGAVRTFGHADFIMGPEGSGMRNMVWAQQAKVVEIFGHEVNFGQWCLAHALGFDFVPYVEERTVPVSEFRWRDIDAQGIPIDPTQLRQFLFRHLGE